jgi:hypothetical protein
MAFIKHVGRHSATGQRLVVVFMQLPDEPENALVVYSDSLPDRYHQTLMEAVESPEGQASKQLYEALSRKVFWHGIQILQTLHQERFLVKVPTKSVIMTPNSATSISLDELLEKMSETDDNVSAPATETKKSTKSQVDVNVEESKNDENKQIAQNLLVQAQLLESDAKRKREEAYKYDPSLKPAEPKISTTDETKKRGRPKKEATA